MSKELTDALRKLVGVHEKDIPSIVIGEVTSVDADLRVCNVTTVSANAEIDIPEVSLMANKGDGLLLVPKVGSSVLVALTKSDAFILMYSDLDAVTLLSDEYGGLVIIDDLVTQLNTQLAAFKTAITAAFTAQTGVDSSAGLNAWNSAKTAIQDLDKTTLENTSVNHGKQ